ncbi:MAG TPA: redox-sensing transcriptional repressor Rex [Candidatus Avilachnospira avicola]|nr:redox-sensing transcriptional repressor Rex [Candidatus Avilachnospira avicola]
MEQKEKKISKAIIQRLPRYYRYLGELLSTGVDRISSSDFSKLMGVTASQIRQDLNNFGGFGQQGYGYNVKNLYEEIGKILGIDRVHNIIVIGAGNFGKALAGYSDFERRGFRIKALFDKDASKVGKTYSGIEILPMDSIKDYIRDNNIEIAALTVPKDSAIELANELKDTGIKGIWNFAHTDLDVPEDIVVENVHLSESIMRLSYNMKSRSIGR